MINNFARKPQGNDRSQIIAVANGEADLAIANSYYIGIMLSGSAGKEQLEAAQKVRMLFLDVTILELQLTQKTKYTLLRKLAHIHFFSLFFRLGVRRPKRSLVVVFLEGH